MLPLWTIVTRLAVVRDRVLNRHPHQPLGAGLGDRLDADAGIRRNPLPHFLRQEFDDPFGLRRALGPLDAGVHVFGVLAEDDDVHALGVRDRRRRAVEVADRPDAGVEVQHLTQRDVQAADAAADRRRQRPLDRDFVGLDRFERVVRAAIRRSGSSPSRRRESRTTRAGACRRRPSARRHRRRERSRARCRARCRRLR